MKVAGSAEPLFTCGHLFTQTGSRFNSSPPGQNGRHFADNIFTCIFTNEKFCILITISLKFVPKGLIDNMLALVQVIAWHLTGDKPLSEPVMTQFTDAYVALVGDELTLGS